MTTKEDETEEGRTTPQIGKLTRRSPPHIGHHTTLNTSARQHAVIEQDDAADIASADTNEDTHMGMVQTDAGRHCETDAGRHCSAVMMWSHSRRHRRPGKRSQCTGSGHTISPLSIIARILSNTFLAMPWCTGFRMALRRGKGR